MRRTLLACGLAATLAGCAGGHPPPLEPLERAAKAVDGGSRAPDDLAFAAWHAWLSRSDAALLAERAGWALDGDAAEPWALLARAELARRDVDEAGEAAAMLALLEEAPGHALAVIAAGRLAELTGTGRAVDDAVLVRAPPLLSAGRLPVEAQVRLGLALRGVLLSRGEDPAPAVRAAGLIDAASLVGPFSAYSALEAARAFPPGSDAPVAGAYEGPPGIGEVALRPLSIPAGTLALEGEPRLGDVFYALSVAEVAASGRYAVRVSAAAGSSAAVIVDGVPVLARDVASGRPAPQVAAAVIDLDAGAHLVAVRLVRGSDRGTAAVSLVPLEPGAPPVDFRAARPGDAPGLPPALRADERDAGRTLALGADGALLATLLADEGAAGLYAAALDAQGRDPEGAGAILAGALAEVPPSAPLLALRAEVQLDDPALPGAIAQGRAAASLEEALRRDPKHARALLRAAALLRQAGRFEDALGRIEEAEAAAPGRAAAALARARIEEGRGFDVLALAAAREAERREAGRCAAGDSLFELARRFDAAADADAAASAYAACPRGIDRRVEHLRSRGRLADALALAEAERRLAPHGIGEGLRVADLLLALGRPAEAAAAVAALETAWPRLASLPRRRAELLDRAGDAAAARAARERALALDGGDLSLRRTLALERGADVLADVAVDGLARIRAHEKATRSFDTRAVVLLDFAAVEAYADGSAVERIHTVVQVLDKRAIDEYGEVHLPPGAEPIRLRTVKRDGRLLEPEAIAGKDSISLPGLDVGDYVETEYLAPIPPRGPALPGWSATPFFFRSADVPLLESTYLVRAERGAGLELDAHGIAPAERKEEDGRVTVVFRAVDVPALVPEPRSPERTEFLPWVQVGAGAGEGAIVTWYGDGLAATAAPTREVVAFARGAVAKVPAEDVAGRARAIWDRVMAEVNGSEGGWGASASQVLARGRGNRLPLLKAALAAVGIESRYAAIRTFEEDPAPRRFPRNDRWNHLVLAVRAGGDTLWLDPSVRWAPFGVLPPAAAGQPALLLPEPGDDAPRIERVTTPAFADAPAGREVSLELTVGTDGGVRGTGVDRYLGFDAARSRGALENLDPDRRRQAVESALARSFRGLVLEDLEVVAEGPAGAPVELRYRFHAADLARDAGGGRSVLDVDFFAANLGRRFLQRGARATPLLLAAPERLVAEVRIEAPGARTFEAPAAVDLRAPQGSFRREVAEDGGELRIREELAIGRARIAPDEYPAFARWATGVDRAQAAELAIVR